MTGPEFSLREIDLLLGKIQPASNEEWEFVQTNANAQIAGHPIQSNPSSPPPPPGVDELPPAGTRPGSLSRTRTGFVPPTFISKTAEALDKKK